MRSMNVDRPRLGGSSWRDIRFSGQRGCCGSGARWNSRIKIDAVGLHRFGETALLRFADLRADIALKLPVAEPPDSEGNWRSIY